MEDRPVQLPADRPARPRVHLGGLLGISPNEADDNLAEWFYGARTSLTVATVSTLAATLLGVTIGLPAGFSRGWLDKVINFMIDVFLSLPFLLVALALSPIIVSRFGNDPDQLKFWQFGSLLIVLSLFGWMTLRARARRGAVAAGAGVRAGGPGHRRADATDPVQASCCPT